MKTFRPIELAVVVAILAIGAAIFARVFSAQPNEP